MNTPQIIVREFLFGWFLERGDSNPLRIHAAKNIANRAVFAARVDRLKQNQLFVAAVGIQPALECHQFIA